MRRFLNNPMGMIFLLLLASEMLLNNPYGSPMDWLMAKILILPGILIGLSFHEFAHAKVAEMCGDDTPRFQGRVTINPGAHVDPFGFISLIFIGFGWGRPVEINPRNFKNPRRDELLVGLAGVTMNLILAAAFVGIIKIIAVVNMEFLFTSLGRVILQVLQYVVQINLVLMIFNLIPVPPLDGFNVAAELFNFRYKPIYYKLHEKGFLILMLLILFNITGMILSPLVNFFFNLLFNLFGL